MGRSRKTPGQARNYPSIWSLRASSSSQRMRQKKDGVRKMESSRRWPDLRAALPSRGSNARCHGKWVKHHACWIQVKSPVPQENQGQGHHKLNIERTCLGDICINHFVVTIAKYMTRSSLGEGRAYVSFGFWGDTVYHSLATGVRDWTDLQDVNWSHGDTRSKTRG